MAGARSAARSRASGSRIQRRRCGKRGGHHRRRHDRRCGPWRERRDRAGRCDADRARSERSPRPRDRRHRGVGATAGGISQRAEPGRGLHSSVAGHRGAHRDAGRSQRGPRSRPPDAPRGGATGARAQPRRRVAAADAAPAARGHSRRRGGVRSDPRLHRRQGPSRAAELVGARRRPDQRHEQLRRRREPAQDAAHRRRLLDRLHQQPLRLERALPGAGPAVPSRAAVLAEPAAAPKLRRELRVPPHQRRRDYLRVGRGSRIARSSPTS